jgi:MATE family multidrug resistance protein
MSKSSTLKSQFMDKQIIQHSILSEIKANLLLSLPLMAAWVIYSLGPFSGTAMIAHLGKEIFDRISVLCTNWRQSSQRICSMQ